MTESSDRATPRCNLLVLRCRDLERAQEFYAALGLSFAEETHGAGPRHYAAEMSGMTFELYPGEPDPGTRVGFTVGQLDKTVATLAGAGAEIQSAPRDSAWGRRAVVVDPDGRRVELVEA